MERILWATLGICGMIWIIYFINHSCTYRDSIIISSFTQFITQNTKKAKKIKFLDFMILKGEVALEWAMGIDEVAELADLESIKVQDMKLMKY